MDRSPRINGPISQTGSILTEQGRDENTRTTPLDQSTLAPGLRLLPTSVREDVYRLYNVLRSLDDLVDEDQPQAEERVAAVEAWTCGMPLETPETRVLQEISKRHDLPRDALYEFCQGMRHDVARRTIYTEDELERYCQRVGGTVGVMLARMLETRDPVAATQMAKLGRAVQRTNILRDIDVDAAHDRIYIAQETIDRFGLPLPGAREALLRDQIARADALYDQAANATSLLATGVPGMTLCAVLYRRILRQVEQVNYQKGQESQPRAIVIQDNRSSARHHKETHNVHLS